MKLKKYLEIKYKCTNGCVGTATTELIPNQGVSHNALAERAHAQGVYCPGKVSVTSWITYNRYE